MTGPRTLVVMEGDQTGQELLEEALRVIDPAVTGLPLAIERHDLSLENRRRTRNQVVFEAAEATVRHGFGLKAATITPEGAEDVGSPNALLREAIGGKVIIRTGRRLSGVRPVGRHPRADLDRAHGGGRRLQRPRVPRGRAATTRSPGASSASRGAPAGRWPSSPSSRRGACSATVFGGPKWTVSPVYEGHAEGGARRRRRAPPRRALPAAADRRDLRGARSATPATRWSCRPSTATATACRTWCSSSSARSRAPSRSSWPSTTTSRRRAVMAEAPHGTAPTLQGKNVANPLAMILAAASVLPYMGDGHAAAVSRAIYEGALEAVAEDVRTRRPRRPHRHRRVHRRGDQARADQARRVGRPRRERVALLAGAALGTRAHPSSVSGPSARNSSRSSTVKRPLCMEATRP